VCRPYGHGYSNADVDPYAHEYTNTHAYAHTHFHTDAYSQRLLRGSEVPLGLD